MIARGSWWTRSYTGVRRYLPLLLDTIKFHATDAGEPVLEAVTALKLSAGIAS